jgi:hypothetical protein
MRHSTSTKDSKKKKKKSKKEEAPTLSKKEQKRARRLFPDLIFRPKLLEVKQRLREQASGALLFLLTESRRLFFLEVERRTILNSHKIKVTDMRDLEEIQAEPTSTKDSKKKKKKS